MIEVGDLYRHPLVQVADPGIRDITAARVAEAEARLCGALALWLQGRPEGLQGLLGESAIPLLTGTPIVSLFGACATAVGAAVGDDASRGWAAVTALQERSAEYAAVAVELRARHAAQRPG